MRHLLPEWHPQWGVLLAWPDQHTDWADHLVDAERCYLAILAALLDHQGVLLVCRSRAAQHYIEQRLAEAGIDPQRLQIVIADYNDTWARDFGPIAVSDNGQTRLLDFTFTGWGGKFAADKDNRLNQQLPWALPVDSLTLILEGGAIDTDGNGNLLTTRHCLGNPNRNAQLGEAELTEQLQQLLGVKQIWWLDHGELEGDDTDAHVDTLARFVDSQTIAYVQCQDPSDSHYASLQRMEQELQILATQQQLTLVPLPLPEPQFSEDGERLPATYANFLISNNKILLPIYGCSTDAAAIAAMAGVAGQRQVCPIDCRVLIEQHGSLHCVTMQLPEGALQAGTAGAATNEEPA